MYPGQIPKWKTASHITISHPITSFITSSRRDLAPQNDVGSATPEVLVMPKSEVLAVGVLTPPAVVVAAAGAELPPTTDDPQAATMIQAVHSQRPAFTLQ